MHARTCTHTHTQEAAAAVEATGGGNEVKVWSCICAHMLHVWQGLQSAQVDAAVADVWCTA